MTLTLAGTVRRVTVVLPLAFLSVTAGCESGSQEDADRVQPAQLLRGERRHDFGEVLLASGEKEQTLEHTFEIVNEGDEVIRILEVKTTCGCAAAEPQVSEILPGDTVAIHTSLKLSSFGFKHENVHVITNTQGIVTLTLSATIRVPQSLMIYSPTVVLDESGRGVATVAVASLDDRAPPKPVLAASAGLECDVGRWIEVVRLDASKGVPARWQAPLTVTREIPELTPQARVMLTLPGEDQPVFARVRLAEPNAKAPW